MINGTIHFLGLIRVSTIIYNTVAIIETIHTAYIINIKINQMIG